MPATIPEYEEICDDSEDDSENHHERHPNEQDDTGLSQNKITTRENDGEENDINYAPSEEEAKETPMIRTLFPTEEVVDMDNVEEAKECYYPEEEEEEEEYEQEELYDEEQYEEDYDEEEQYESSPGPYHEFDEEDDEEVNPETFLIPLLLPEDQTDPIHPEMYHSSLQALHAQWETHIENTITKTENILKDQEHVMEDERAYMQNQAQEELQEAMEMMSENEQLFRKEISRLENEIKESKEICDRVYGDNVHLAEQLQLQEKMYQEDAKQLEYEWEAKLQQASQASSLQVQDFPSEKFKEVKDVIRKFKIEDLRSSSPSKVQKDALVEIAAETYEENKIIESRIHDAVSDCFKSTNDFHKTEIVNLNREWERKMEEYQQHSLLPDTTDVQVNKDISLAKQQMEEELIVKLEEKLNATQEENEQLRNRVSKHQEELVESTGIQIRLEEEFESKLRQEKERAKLELGEEKNEMERVYGKLMEDEIAKEVKKIKEDSQGTVDELAKQNHEELQKMIAQMENDKEEAIEKVEMQLRGQEKDASSKKIQQSLEEYKAKFEAEQQKSADELVALKDEELSRKELEFVKEKNEMELEYGNLMKHEIAKEATRVKEEMQANFHALVKKKEDEMEECQVQLENNKEEAIEKALVQLREQEKDASSTQVQKALEEYKVQFETERQKAMDELVAQKDEELSRKELEFAKEKNEMVLEYGNLMEDEVAKEATKVKVELQGNFHALVKKKEEEMEEYKFQIENNMEETIEKATAKLREQEKDASSTQVQEALEEYKVQFETEQHKVMQELVAQKDEELSQKELELAKEKNEIELEYGNLMEDEVAKEVLKIREEMQVEFAKEKNKIELECRNLMEDEIVKEAIKAKEEMCKFRIENNMEEAIEKATAKLREQEKYISSTQVQEALEEYKVQFETEQQKVMDELVALKDEELSLKAQELEEQLYLKSSDIETIQSQLCQSKAISETLQQQLLEAQSQAHEASLLREKVVTMECSFETTLEEMKTQALSLLKESEESQNNEISSLKSNFETVQENSERMLQKMIETKDKEKECLILKISEDSDHHKKLKLDLEETHISAIKEIRQELLNKKSTFQKSSQELRMNYEVEISMLNAAHVTKLQESLETKNNVFTMRLKEMEETLEKERSDNIESLKKKGELLVEQHEQEIQKLTEEKLEVVNQVRQEVMEEFELETRGKEEVSAELNRKLQERIEELQMEKNEACDRVGEVQLDYEAQMDKIRYDMGQEAYVLLSTEVAKAIAHTEERMEQKIDLQIAELNHQNESTQQGLIEKQKQMEQTLCDKIKMINFDKEETLKEALIERETAIVQAIKETKQTMLETIRDKEEQDQEDGLQVNQKLQELENEWKQKMKATEEKMRQEITEREERIAKVRLEYIFKVEQKAEVHAIEMEESKLKLKEEWDAKEKEEEEEEVNQDTEIQLQEENDNLQRELILSKGSLLERDGIIVSLNQHVNKLVSSLEDSQKNLEKQLLNVVLEKDGKENSGNSPLSNATPTKKCRIAKTNINKSTAKSTVVKKPLERKSSGAVSLSTKKPASKTIKAGTTIKSRRKSVGAGKPAVISSSTTPLKPTRKEKILSPQVKASLKVTPADKMPKKKIVSGKINARKNLTQKRTKDVRILFNVPITERYRKMVKSLGATLLEEISEAQSVTHVIAGDNESNHLRRTPKLMIGLSRTSNIVTIEWLIQSFQKNAFVDCNHYLLINDKEAERRYTFSMKTTLRNGEERRVEGGLLKGWKVFFCDNVAGNRAPPEQELKLIVEAANGCVIEGHLPEGEDTSHVMVITSDPALTTQITNKVACHLAEDGAGFYTTTWLFDCILHQKLIGVKRGLRNEVGGKPACDISGLVLEIPVDKDTSEMSELPFEMTC